MTGKYSCLHERAENGPPLLEVDVPNTTLDMTTYLKADNLHNKIFISADFEAKNFSRKLEKLVNFFSLKIGWNENFIMQMAYGDKKLFYNFFYFLMKNWTS